MKPLNQVLQGARHEKKLSVQQLHQRTSVPLAVITDLEAGDFSRLPTPTIVQGMLEILGEELGLPSTTLSALYRRDGGLSSRASSANQPTRRVRRSWRQMIQFYLYSPRGASWFVGALVGCIALSGLIWQWWHLSQPPLLLVTEPITNTKVSNPVRILGSTEPDNTVTLNTEVLPLDPEGNFRVEQILQPGERTLVLEATDQRGRSQQVVPFLQVQDQ